MFFDKYHLTHLTFAVSKALESVYGYEPERFEDELRLCSVINLSSEVDGGYLLVFENDKYRALPTVCYITQSNFDDFEGNHKDYVVTGTPDIWKHPQEVEEDSFGLQVFVDQTNSVYITDTVLGLEEEPEAKTQTEPEKDEKSD